MASNVPTSRGPKSSLTSTPASPSAVTVVPSNPTVGHPVSGRNENGQCFQLDIDPKSTKPVICPSDPVAEHPVSGPDKDGRCFQPDIDAEFTNPVICTSYPVAGHAVSGPDEDGQCFQLVIDPRSNKPVICPTEKASGSATSWQTSTASESSQVNSAIPESSSKPAVVAPSNGGMKGGAVAGIAIAMLIAGALLAGAVFFFLLRRQKKRQSLSNANYTTLHPPYGDAAALSEKGPTVVTSTVGSNIDSLIPQPVADETITDAVLKIRDNIKNHVRTYYHSAPVPENDIDLAALRELATATDVDSAVLGASLLSPSTRSETLRLVIGWMMLSRCTGERDASLLPAELSKLVAFIPEKDRKNTSQSAMYSKWKAITGVMLQQRFGHGVQGPSRDQAFANISADLDSIVAPFLQGSVDGGQRSKNLDMILTRSANLAFLLFSQPGSFRFDFSAIHGSLVAFPALVQTIGDQGEELRPVRVLLEKEVAA